MSETKYDVFVRLMSNYLVEKIQLDSITRDPHHIDIQREADSWLEEYNHAVDNAERQVGCKECRRGGSLDVAIKMVEKLTSQPMSAIKFCPYCGRRINIKLSDLY